MYAITGSRYHNEDYEKAKGRAYFASEEKFKLPNIPDGTICKIIYPLESGFNIGILNGNYIESGLGSLRHRNLFEEIPIENVEVYILNTDGKQKGKEIVGDNIGNFFPLKSIGTHDTYKYVVEMDGKEICLSKDNVVFVEKNNRIKNPPLKKFINYKGVTLFVLSEPYSKGVTPITGFRALDIKTKQTMYIYDNSYEVIGDSAKINVMGSITELIDLSRAIKTGHVSIEEYQYKNLPFNIEVLVKRKQKRGSMLYQRIECETYYMFKKDFDNISLPNKFKYDQKNSVIYYDE